PGSFREVRQGGRRPYQTLLRGARAFRRRRAHREGRLPCPSDRPPARIAVRHAGRDRHPGGRAPGKEPRGRPRKAARIDLIDAQEEAHAAPAQERSARHGARCLYRNTRGGRCRKYRVTPCVSIGAATPSLIGASVSCRHSLAFTSSAWNLFLSSMFRTSRSPLTGSTAVTVLLMRTVKGASFSRATVPRASRREGALLRVAPPKDTTRG